MSDDTSISSELLEPTLPGVWVAEHRRIWQMNFLDAHDLARFCSDHSLSDFREEGIIQLWQLGLLQNIARFVEDTRDNDGKNMRSGYSKWLHSENPLNGSFIRLEVIS
jgi:hypothetical protein